MIITIFISLALTFGIGLYYGYVLKEIQVPEYECNFTLVI